METYHNWQRIQMNLNQVISMDRVILCMSAKQAATFFIILCYFNMQPLKCVIIFFLLVCHYFKLSRCKNKNRGFWSILWNCFPCQIPSIYCYQFFFFNKPKISNFYCFQINNYYLHIVCYAKWKCLSNNFHMPHLIKKIIKLKINR